jgi:hypothetical protein
MFESGIADNSLGNRIYRVTHSKQPWRFGAGLLVLILAFVPIVMLMMGLNSYADDRDTFPFSLLPGDENFAVNVSIALTFVAFFLLSYLSGSLFRTWKISQELTAADAMAADTRPPILYLRPFAADKLGLATIESKRSAGTRSMLSNFGILGLFLATFLWGYGYGRKRKVEELIVDMLTPLGPVIAIGRPGETLPPIGAARLYCGNDWKDVIRDFMAKSQFIIMFAGTTPGFAWEVAEAFRTIPFVPTILLLPYFNKHDDQDVRNFLTTWSSGSGLAMPSDLHNVRAIHFPTKLQAIAIHDLETPEEKRVNQINPFESSIGRILHPNNPQWISDAANEAKDRIRSARRPAFILGAIILLLALLRFVGCQA